LRLCAFASQIISRKGAKAQRILLQLAIDMTLAILFFHENLEKIPQKKFVSKKMIYLQRQNNIILIL